jgi:hypothetical protein
MKTGLSLSQMAAELERRQDTARDYIAAQGALKVEVAPLKVAPVVVDPHSKEAPAVKHDIVLRGIGQEAHTIREHAHGQIAEDLGIPKRYYDRMRAEAPALLGENINTWLGKAPATKRMVRTLDGSVRAVLSSSYRPLDNFALANAALPILMQRQAQVVSSDLTEQRMYVKAILPSLSGEVPEGLQLGKGHNFLSKDVVVAGIVISNSEVGAGAVRVEPMVFKTRCTNLMIVQESKMRKYHIGKDQGLDVEGHVEELLRTETREKRDAAFWMSVRDIVAAAFDEKRFRAHVESMTRAAGDAIVSADLPKVVEVTVKRLALPEGLGGNILKHLSMGGDMSRWGLLNAVTRTAEDVDQYETATLLERAGGEVLALAPQEWKTISEAAA